jgi:SAM-dependent methyltransferase
MPVLRALKERLLAVPAIYRLHGKVIGLGKDRSVYAREHVRARPGDRVLDIGCGPAEILGWMPPVDYVGFDLSPEYVAAAKRRWGERGRFYCERVSEASLDRHRDFDVVVATGVLHHLDDEEAEKLFRLAHAALVPGGRLVTLDGVWTDDQSRVAKMLLARDRGEHVRRKEAYVELASRVFPKVRPTVREDLLALPYTLLVMECEKA